jgi:hypothetical protein
MKWKYVHRHRRFEVLCVKTRTKLLLFFASRRLEAWIELFQKLVIYTSAMLARRNEEILPQVFTLNCFTVPPA